MHWNYCKTSLGHLFIWGGAINAALKAARPDSSLDSLSSEQVTLCIKKEEDAGAARNEGEIAPVIKVTGKQIDNFPEWFGDSLDLPQERAFRFEINLL